MPFGLFRSSSQTSSDSASLAPETSPSKRSTTRSWIAAGALALLLGAGFYAHKTLLIVPSLTGPKIISESYLKALVQAPAFQRLRGVDQSGPVAVFGFVPPFSRYEHSIGVWALLKEHNRTLPEQAAGLLHDVSHTAFSHMADYLFAKGEDYQHYANDNYQDSIHEDYLKNHGLTTIAERHHQTPQSLDPETPAYRALEQPGPDLCADRIDYILRTGVVMGLLPQAEAKEILKDLRFNGRDWFFTNASSAKRFATLALYFTQNFWAAPWNVSANIHFAKAVRRVIDLGALTKEDLFRDDAFVLAKVKEHLDDPYVLACWTQCEKGLEKLDGVTYQTTHITPKFRGVNPFVQGAQGELVRLTAIDALFCNAFEETKAWCQRGFDIDMLEMA